MLRRGFLVEVEHDHIIVRVTGTSYAASYYRMASSTGLVARNLPLRDDHRAPMSRLEFIKNSWELAKAKAQELRWIERDHWGSEAFLTQSHLSSPSLVVS
jgi:hypothetical protein